MNVPNEATCEILSRSQVISFLKTSDKFGTSPPRRVAAPRRNCAWCTRMALCSFTGDACLPGLNLLPEPAGPNLQRQLCRQRGAVPTFCHSCPGAPVDKTAAHCALWGTGRMQWSAAEVSAPGPGPDDLCNRSSLAFVAPRANGACARPLPLRSDALRLLGGQTIAFVGDSLMRQVFTRTVAWMRGQSTLADPAFHSDGAARLVAHPRPPTHITPSVRWQLCTSLRASRTRWCPCFRPTAQLAPSSWQTARPSLPLVRRASSTSFTTRACEATSRRRAEACGGTRSRCSARRGGARGKRG